MQTQDPYQFKVVLSHDSETKQTVAQVPALDIADYGIDTEKALSSLQDMLTFHLECLVAEGKAVPREEGHVK